MKGTLMAKKKQLPEEVAHSEAYVKDFFDMAVPSAIRFNVDHFICGDSYRSVWAIREYPPQTSDQALLARFGDKEAVTVHLYTRLVDGVEQRKILQNASRKNKLLANSNDLEDSVTGEGNLGDVVELLGELRKNREPLLHCAVFLELSAGNLDKLRELQSDVSMEMTREKISVDHLSMRQKEGFIACMPCGYNIFGTQYERVLPASAVANLFPFNYSGKTDKNGFYLGKDKFGTNIIADFDQRADDKTNSNVLILGNSGQGKSYLLKLILTNTRMAGKSVICLDAEQEYKDLCNNLGGCYIDLMSGQYKAKAEKYAKIISKTIILSGMEGGNFGQNAYFYDAAEGLLTASILLVSEFCKPAERHIVSVFKIIQELLAPGKGRNRNQFQQLMEKLPADHKAKWFAGAALNTAEQSMASVMSTALSRLNAFLDSELETILCNDTEIDAERFCKEKSAIFIIMPEEDSSKYFMVSLLIQQLYREILAVADEHGGKLENRVVFYCDEFGTLPRIESAEMMFSASRSRRVSIVPIIQSFAQLQKNYGKEGAEIIIDNTQWTVFGGFAPNSESAQILSKAMGSRTALTGSVTQSKGEGSRSLQMIERPLMTPDELKALPKGTFIVTKTGFYPIKVKLKLFFKWGIRFEKEPFTVPMRDRATICYASREELSEAICNKYHVADDKSNGKDIPDGSFRVEEAMAERHYSSKKAAARHKGLRTNLGQDGGTK